MSYERGCQEIILSVGMFAEKNLQLQLKPQPQPQPQPQPTGI